MACLSTERVIVTGDASATMGRVRWAPVRSLWMMAMTGAALGFVPIATTPGAIMVWLASSAATLCLGHSIGLHRLLIHRSFETSRWLERVLIYLGTLVGMAGPLGMVRLHDIRDWAQRQRECHDLHAHRAWLPKDAWWQMHCRLELERPPRFDLGPLAADPYLRMLERTWMAQQLPWAVVLWWLGGLPWLVWGVPVRVAVSVTGHWLVGHITHRQGPQGWVGDGTAVQGHDLPAAALITFGESWHGNHHAWPSSARLGIEAGQPDPGWWVLVALRRAGLVWNLKEPHALTPRPGLRRLKVDCAQVACGSGCGADGVGLMRQGTIAPGAGRVPAASNIAR